MNTVSTPTAIKPVDFNTYEKVDGSLVFPELYSKGEVQITRRKFRHQNCVDSNPDYIADEMLLRRALAWWFGLPDPLGFAGETGSGKTELFYYIADKLNEPVYLLQVNGGLMPEMVEGKTSLAQGETVDEMGVVPHAYKHGGLILLDEVDKANKALQSWLHPVLERKPLSLSLTGELIMCHDQTRVGLTANTFGQGGSERYSSSNKLDDALRARPGWLTVKYPEPSVLRNIMAKKFSMIPAGFRKKMCQVALEVQKVTENEDSELSAIFSTRTLVKWGQTMVAFGLSAKVEESLDFVSRGACDPDDWESLQAIYQRILGEDKSSTVGDVLKKYTPVKK